MTKRSRMAKMVEPKGEVKTEVKHKGEVKGEVKSKLTAYDRKVRDAGELCRREGIAFIPVVAESLGGVPPHGGGPAEAAGQGGLDEDWGGGGTAFNHLLGRVSLTLMKGLCSLVLNCN